MKQLKTFAAYVAPSVFACALSGIYAIVDGFFVGNSVGDIGLSAINIAQYTISDRMTIALRFGFPVALRIVRNQAGGIMFPVIFSRLILSTVAFPVSKIPCMAASCRDVHS